MEAVRRVRWEVMRPRMILISDMDLDNTKALKNKMDTVERWPARKLGGQSAE